MELEQNTVGSQETEQTSRTNASKRTWFRWFWRSLCILGLLLIATVAFLSTATGQKTLLNTVVTWADGLSVNEAEGRLQDGLTLKDVRYQLDGVDVSVGQADLHIGFGCLWDKKACIEHVALRDTSVVIDTTKLPPTKPKNDTPMAQLSLPLPISLKQLSLDNVNVKVDETDIFLKYFHSGLEGEQQNLTLLPTEMHGLTISLPAQAAEKEKKTAQSGGTSLREKIDWAEWEKQLSQPLLNKLEPIKLPLHLSVLSFNATDIQLERKVKQDDNGQSEPMPMMNIGLIALQGKSDGNTVEVTQFQFQSDKGQVSGHGQLTLADNYPMHWQLNANSPLLAELKIPASQAEMTLSGELLGRTHLALKTTGAVKAELRGAVALSEPKTPFELQLNSEKASYPFIPEKSSEPLTLNGLALSLNGNVTDYRLDGSTALYGMGVPAAKIHLKGQGGLQQFELAELALEMLGGKARLSGKLGWTDGVEWQSQAQFLEVQTASLLADWPAVLNGGLHSKGYIGRGKQGNEWAVSINEMDIHGRLFDRKLQLIGELNSDVKTLLSVPAAKLIYGENTISLKGVVSDKSDFSAEIDAPNLKGLLPNLQAKVKGHVKLQGKPTEPELFLDLAASNVAYETFALQHFVAKGKVTTQNQIFADLNLQLKQLGVGEIKLSQADIALKGSEENHQLKLTSSGEPLGVNLQISGKFDRLQQRWQGQLSQVDIQSEFGKVSNDKPVQVNYHHKQLNSEISAHCWLHSNLTLCFPNSFQAGIEGKVPFEIKQFNLAMLQEYLDKNTQLSGIVKAKGDIAWFKNAAPQVNVAVNATPLELKQRIDGVMLPLNLTSVSLNAALKENKLQLKSEVQIENNGWLKSDFSMNDITRQRKLGGNIQIKQLNLSLLKPLLRQGERLEGEINAHLTLGGNVQSPLLYGDLNLTQLKAQSKMMPFEMVDGGLVLHFAGAKSTLNGSVRSQEGVLSLSGDADWHNLKAWRTHIQAKSEKFRLDLPDLGKVDVGPNIDVNVTPTSLNLSGNIDIPWARIEVQELPESAISISGDEVIMDGSVKHKRSLMPLNQKNSPKAGNGMAINGDISVNIGQDVRLEAYGLKTHLRGLLKVRQGNRGLGLYGQVNLHNGTFASFGQDLIIRKGLISFTGLPSQPTLDIEAIRNPAAMDDTSITAGVRATGLADDLDVTIFSDPSMSQDQALSYLLTGRGLDNSEGASSNSVAAALIGLGLSKSSKTVGSVGSAFGISDLNVSTEGIGDNTKVVVSGNLNSRLKVEYGVGLFAPLTELALRYRLAPNLYLQWVSGINQAVDLLYRFEFD